MESQHVSIYKITSGQVINYDKSSIYFSANMAGEDINLVCGKLHIYESGGKSNYLSLPSLIGRNKRDILEIFYILK